MSAIAKLSVTNHTATSTSTASSSLAGYLPANAEDATRPMLPWRTNNVITASTLVFDFGSSKVVDLIILGNVNVASVSVQLDNDSGFSGADNFDTGTLTIARNPWNDRYTRAILVTQTKRWLRVSIPGQTPVDGAAYFEVGYVWAGPASVLPTGWALQTEIESEYPESRTEAQLGRWANVYPTGDPFTRIHGTIEPRTPDGTISEFGTGDIATWREVLRTWKVAAGAGLYLNRNNTAEAAVMRLVGNPRFKFGDIAKASCPFETEELMAGI